MFGWLCEEVVWFSKVVNMSGLVAIYLGIILLYINGAYLVIDGLDLEIIKSFIFYLLYSRGWGMTSQESQDSSFPVWHQQGVFIKNISRLWLSCHRLQVETGRYNTGSSWLRPDQRICRYCTLNHCEDKLHFIIEWFESVNNTYPNFMDLDINPLFIFVMSNVENCIINAVRNDVSQCFNKRTKCKVT